MESDSIECISSLDGIDVNEIVHSKTPHNNNNKNNNSVRPATSVHELLECPVCTNSMYPPIHQLGVAPVYMAFLWFMGDETDARNYSDSLEVGGNGRKLIWEGTPRSIKDSHRKVRDSHDGLIIQRNMALFFSGGDRKELKLYVTGKIWKEQQNPDLEHVYQTYVVNTGCTSQLVDSIFLLGLLDTVVSV